MITGLRNSRLHQGARSSEILSTEGWECLIVSGHLETLQESTVAGAAWAVVRYDARIACSRTYFFVCKRAYYHTCRSVVTNEAFPT